MRTRLGTVCGLLFGTLAGYDLAVLLTNLQWFFGGASSNLPTASPNAAVIGFHLLGAIGGGAIGLPRKTVPDEGIHSSILGMILGTVGGLGLGLCTWLSIFFSFPGGPVTLLISEILLGAVCGSAVAVLHEETTGRRLITLPVTGALGAIGGLGLFVTAIILDDWPVIPWLIVGAVCGCVVSDSRHAPLGKGQTMAWWCATTMGMVSTVSWLTVDDYKFFSVLAIAGAFLGIAIGAGMSQFSVKVERR
jgi:hypothetical protein